MLYEFSFKYHPDDPFRVTRIGMEVGDAVMQEVVVKSWKAH
jgi:hypothetical protein